MVRLFFHLALIAGGNVEVVIPLKLWSKENTLMPSEPEDEFRITSSKGKEYVYKWIKTKEALPKEFYVGEAGDVILLNLILRFKLIIQYLKQIIISTVLQFTIVLLI